MAITTTPAPPRPRIALTMGDPAGVGPELAARLLANPANRAKADIYVLADQSEVDAAAAIVGVTIPTAATPSADAVAILDDGTAPTTPVVPRAVSVEAGARTLHQLNRALALANAGKVDAIVFTPLNKTSLHMAGMHEEDELRWFAKALSYDGPTSEINIIKGLWTARVTSHVGIKDVAALVTRESTLSAITLLHSLLSDSGIQSPRIGICSLNPHNGENGLFGTEEIEHIRPAVADAKANGIDADGPYPCDTIFLARHKYDGIVSMYHDQGQIAIKLLGFDGGVTVQGGLPVVIATPAHGTAFDIAGTGKASVNSSQNALDVAIAIAGRRAARRAEGGKKVNGVSVPPAAEVVV
ncbi:Putative 4-hydroxythreonine-4-phosphate dehydrogenase 2 [Vanrija pseudolonga]|uniref:4-hydroxythreonine-4-phosphate dehydrogenase 2 n=1 Tax=Vanrija pseudolonga TaxID=143232 RepID=A0AAF0Y767_9TREE|nr:Putative 4-hydroxythreonine-4-phosphate dehydrogenase 2 [Vanrija pseudolonga]